jgi:glycosyltransferase involved in cell wall biosynthesis
MSTDISLMFPVFKDERTVRIVAKKALRLLQSAADEYEIIIVNDGSPDQSGDIADELSKQYPCIRVIHHQVNLGYGRAIRSGLSACRYDTICMIDGDDQYEVGDFSKLLKLRDFYDLIITFRYKKVYSGVRVFISWIYNKTLRLLFRTPFRDVSTGIRVVRKALIDDICLESTSPFIGAELAIKAMLKGYRVGEVGIQTFPREFGKGSSTSVKNIVATIREMWRSYRTIFSDEYDLPTNRTRNGKAK